jgi:hypothetical protein
MGGDNSLKIQNLGYAAAVRSQSSISSKPLNSRHASSFSESLISVRPVYTQYNADLEHAKKSVTSPAEFYFSASMTRLSLSRISVAIPSSSAFSTACMDRRGSTAATSTRPFSSS